MADGSRLCVKSGDTAGRGQRAHWRPSFGVVHCGAHRGQFGAAQPTAPADSREFSAAPARTPRCRYCHRSSSTRPRCGDAGGAAGTGFIVEADHRNMRKVIQGVIRIYQRTLSPLLGPRCRFYPSCSQYAYEALEVHGVALGLWLVVRRLSRCHPFHPGGLDPVPPHSCTKATHVHHA